MRSTFRALDRFRGWVGCRTPRAWVILTCAFALVTLAGPDSKLRAGAAEAPAQPETSARVGMLGRPEAVEIEGASSFSVGEIRRALAHTPSLRILGHPTADLATYMRAVRTMVERGYQHSGFGRVSVEAVADPAAARIRVRIKEGPMLVAGPVRITGLDEGMSSRLLAWLRSPAPEAPPLNRSKPSGARDAQGRLEESARQLTAEMLRSALARTNATNGSWEEGKPAELDRQSLDRIRSAVLKGLAGLGVQGEDVRVEWAEAGTGSTAELRIAVGSVKPLPRLGQVQVFGSTRDSRETFLRYCGLSPGMPVPPALAASVTNRLYLSGRYRSHTAQAGGVAPDGTVPLEIRVDESDEAPPLDGKLSAEEEAMLSLRKWLSDPARWQHDLVVDLEVRQTNGPPLYARLSVSAKNSVLEVRHVREADQPPAYALDMSPAGFSAHAIRGRRRLEVPRPDRNDHGVVQYVRMVPFDDPMSGRNRITYGFSLRSRTAAPYEFQFELAPVSLLESLRGGQHARSARVTRESEIVLIEFPRSGVNSPIRLRIEAATGRLVELGWAEDSIPGNYFQLVVRTEPGAVAIARRRVALASQGSTNVYQPGAPLQSLVRFVLPELGTGGALSGWMERPPGFASELKLAEWASLLGGVDWANVRRPLGDLDRLMGRQMPGEKWFPIVNGGDSMFPDVEAGADPLRMGAMAALAVVDDLWPQGGWALPFFRGVALLHVGQTNLARADLAAAIASPDCGPIAAGLCGRFLAATSPADATRLLEVGIARLQPAKVQAELELLLGGGPGLPRVGAALVDSLMRMDAKDIRRLGTLLGETNHDGASSTWVRPGIAAVARLLETAQGRTNRPFREVLGETMSQEWTTSFEPMLRDWLESCPPGVSEPKTARGRYVAAMTLLQRSDARREVGRIRSLLLESAKAGYRPSWVLLARAEASGLDSTPDWETALAHLRNAGREGERHAWCLAGNIRANTGTSLELDPEAWEGLLKDAADGCGLAQALVGYHLVGRRPEEGIRWLLRAAQNRMTGAYAPLARALDQSGKTGEAMDWYESAAEAGDVPSMAALGELLSDGFSPRQDPAKSYRWLRLASEGGHAVSVFRAQRVKQRLTPAQVELEERRIRRFKHRIFVSGKAGVGRP